MAHRFSPQFKARALDLLAERRRLEGSQESAWKSCQAVASSLGGISPHTLCTWYKRQRADGGLDAGPTTTELEELRRLRRKIRELRRANETLKAASAFFASPVQPSRTVMIAFIDEYRDRFGVERICRVLSEHMEGGFITSRGYRAA